jgi:hypothetical protein
VRLIDRTDPEEDAKKKIENLFLQPGFDENNRQSMVRQLKNTQYRLGLPLKDPSELERLLALHPAVARVAADQLKAKWEIELRNGSARREEVQLQLDSMNAVLDWIDANPSLKLEKNDCSRLHKLKAAAKGGRIVGNDAEPVEKQGALTGIENTFVVRHDWRAAFDGAEGLSETFRFPYDLCAFEFRIAGRTIIAACCQNEDSQRFTCLIESGDYWYPLCGDGEIRKGELEGNLATYIWVQIQSLCIALDAEVATHTVVRAPHALNEKRARNGQLPLSDYHVVDLSRRHRIANPSGRHDGGKRRLHFRRGHWRHYETSKTWVRWCLVGDPDLGFIQKHYSL